MNLLGHKHLLGNRASKSSFDGTITLSTAYTSSIVIGRATGAKRAGQSFIIPVEGTFNLQQVSYGVAKVGTHPTGYLYAYIYTDDSGLPGTSLGYVRVSHLNVSTQQDNVEQFMFNGSIQLSGLTRYWIVAATSYTSTSYYYLVKKGATDYEDGTMATYDPWTILDQSTIAFRASVRVT